MWIRFNLNDSHTTRLLVRFNGGQVGPEMKKYEKGWDTDVPNKQTHGVKSGPGLSRIKQYHTSRFQNGPRRSIGIILIIRALNTCIKAPRVTWP